jgi:plasmid stability protein
MATIDLPQQLVERLKEQAKGNHRSIEAELRALLESPQDVRKFTADEVYFMGKEMRLKTGDESTRWIREDRDAR